jgi:hypothetical protein
MPERARAAAVATETKVGRTSCEDRAREPRRRPQGVHAQLLQRQRTFGNQAVTRFIESGGPAVRRTCGEACHCEACRTERDPSGPDVGRKALARREPSRVAPSRADAAARAGVAPQPSRPRALAPVAPARASTHAAGPLVQRAWYNVDIPFTDYQFDPSIEGIKTAAGVVKDTAVEAFDFIVDEIRELVSDGIDWITEKWNAIEQFATSAFSAAQEFFGSIVAFVKNPLGFLADAFTSLDERAIAKAWSTFSGLVSLMGENFKLVAQNLVAPLESLWGRMSGYATSLVDKIDGLVARLPGTVERVVRAVIEPLTRLWTRVSDAWRKLVAKVKAWVDEALDTVLSFVSRVASFAIDGVLKGIAETGRLVLFLKDLFTDPHKYVAILAEKAVAGFAGVENAFGAVVARHFGSPVREEAPAPTTTIQRQPAPDASDAPRSAAWAEIGEGILAMMGKKWHEFTSNPIALLTTLLLDLVLPVVGNVKDVIHLFGEIRKIVTGPLGAGSLEEFWTSLLRILDIPILIYQTVVGILMRTLTLPLIVATFVPHPVVKGIAAAVGYALLGAFAQVEVANIAHKLLLLKTGSTRQAQKTEAYNRVADSLIAMAMTAVIIIIVIVIHFLAGLVKGVFNFVRARVFPAERVPARGKAGAPESRGRGTPEEGRAAESRAAREGMPSEDGQRKLRINEEGRCQVCASPCDEVRRRYASVLTQDIDGRITAIERNPALTDADRIAQLRPVEQELANLSKSAREVGQWERSGHLTPDEAAGLKERLVSDDPAVRAEAQREVASERKRIERESYGEEFEDEPRHQRMSDANKAELQESGWLRERLPSVADRRAFMKWLERGHKQGEAHEHLRPGSPEAEAKLGEWAAETDTPIVTPAGR